MEKLLKLKLLILVGLLLTTQSFGDQIFMKGLGWDGYLDNTQYIQDLGAEYARICLVWKNVEPVLLAPYPTVAEVDADPSMISDYISSVDWTVTDNQINPLLNIGATVVPRIAFGHTAYLPLVAGQAAIPDLVGRDQYLGCA